MFLQLIKAIRPLNLLVITLTFYVLYLLNLHSREILNDYFANQLYDLKFLVISTLLIAAGGYLINDYYDKEIDKINHPNKINNTPKDTLLVVYTGLNLLALVFSYLHANSINLFLLFPFSIFLLWIYSYKLKGLPFVGNLSIALLSGLIPIIYLISQQSYYQDCQTPFSEIYTIEITLTFAILAFFSTLAREIIKDIEDIEGDRHQGLKTIPIALGIKTAKFFSIFFVIITLIFAVLLLKEKDVYDFQTISLIIAALFSLTPLLIAISKIFTGKEKKHFKQAGNLIKTGMFGFLLFLYLHATL